MRCLILLTRPEPTAAKAGPSGSRIAWRMLSPQRPANAPAGNVGGLAAVFFT